MSFSKRNRLNPLPKPQIKKINDQLKNGLWNLIYNTFFHRRTGYSGWWSGDYERLFEKVYDEMFNIRIDDCPLSQEATYQLVKERFLKFKWNQVYDFIEIIAKYYPYKNDSFVQNCNQILEREFSGYSICN